MENSMEIPQKIKNIIHQFNSWVFIERKQKHQLEKIHASLCSLHHYYNSQNMEAIQMPSKTWMDKQDMTYLYNAILLTHLGNHLFVLLIYDSVLLCLFIRSFVF